MQRLKLGYRAGIAVRELLAGVSRGLPMHQRSARRKPLLEIARFKSFKLGREIGEPAIYSETAPHDIQLALRNCRKSPITQLETMQHATWLPKHRLRPSALVPEVAKKAFISDRGSRS